MINNRKTLIIGLGLIVIILVITIILIPKNSNEIAMKPHVKYNIVEDLYKENKKDKVEGNKEYVSKLYGYTYDKEENIEMYVKEGYIENNILYDLSGNELGQYTKEKLNTLLDKGTLKIYKYKKEDYK